MSFARAKSLFTATASTVLALAISGGLANAAATTKTLSTNYTLVNLGSSSATVTVNYYKEDGNAWAAASSSTNFTVPGNGGQAIIAQYFDTTMISGRGSAVVASDQPLGAVVQILARNQTPTSGAYIGSSSTDTTYYVPLVMRKLNSTSSQIMIQNAGTSVANVTITLVKALASAGSNYTKSGITIQPGATYYYDLSDELPTNVADSWYGSAVVSGGSVQLSVISNLFAGTDQLQTFNGFRSNQLSTTWYVPLFASRLGNALSTPVSVQNLSGSTIAINGLSMTCTPDAGAAGASPFTIQNNTAISNNESFFFNPVVNTSIPATWFGSCKITAPGNVAVFVQMRQPGVNSSAAAYEAINANGTSTTVLVPLVAKVLTNGFATPVTIQNLGATAATVNITYTPNANCAGCQTYSESNVTIPANGSLIRNFRLTTTVSSMPTNWYGTMRVQSTSNPIDGFVQLTTVGGTAGDTLMAHGVFTLP